MRRLTSFLATPAGRAARYLISLTLLWLLARQIDFTQLATLQGQFSLPLTITAVLIAGITYPLHAWRWQQLLRAQGVPLSLHWAHVVTWIGQFYNAFLLGGIGGDAARVFYIVRDASAQRAAGFTTLIIDRAMGLVVLMALAAAALAARSLSFAVEPRLGWLFFAAIAICISGGLTAVVLLRVNPTRWPQPLRRLLGPARLATACQLLDSIRATPLVHLTALGLGGVIWILDFISAWLLALAIGLDLCRDRLTHQRRRPRGSRGRPADNPRRLRPTRHTRAPRPCCTPSFARLGYHYFLEPLRRSFRPRRPQTSAANRAPLLTLQPSGCSGPATGVTADSCTANMRNCRRSSLSRTAGSGDFKST